jgi:phosphotriesterase-related protein
MDRFGLDQFLPQEKRITTIAKLCEMGHAEKMVLSHDASCYFDWAPGDLLPLVVPNWHFNYIPDVVIPDLKKAGVTDDQIQTMTVDNPRRIFERQGSY